MRSAPRQTEQGVPMPIAQASGMLTGVARARGSALGTGAGERARAAENFALLDGAGDSPASTDTEGTPNGEAWSQKTSTRR